MNYSDQELSGMLRQGDQEALKYLFDLYYRDLVIHAMKMVVNLGVAEELVEDVFIRLWENRNSFILEKTFGSYLFTSVKNRSINYLKSSHGRIRFDNLDQIGEMRSNLPADGEILLGELKQEIWIAIEKLPPKCRIIFNLSRNAGMNTEEIARHMGISKKTVHAQIAIAIRKIKTQLGDNPAFLL